MALELVHRPVYAPSKCIACGGGAGEPAIDTGVDLPPPVGHVYICESCAHEIAHRLNYVAHERCNSLLASIDELELQLAASYEALRVERENKTISLADAKKLIAGAKR